MSDDVNCLCEQDPHACEGSCDSVFIPCSIMFTPARSPMNESLGFIMIMKLLCIASIRDNLDVVPHPTLPASGGGRRKAQRRSRYRCGSNGYQPRAKSRIQNLNFRLAERRYLNVVRYFGRCFQISL